ncbi:MAG: inositol monophosphatase family protein [Mycobacteriales bacterium]
MFDLEYDELLELASAVAREAGALLLAGQPAVTAVVATKSSPTDVVTEMDRRAERLIVDRLLAARPGDGVLGEEGASRDGRTGVRWVIDPIDGTVNYLYQLPNFAVAIAAEVDGVAVAGAVYDPSRDAMWTAVRGRGAFRNGAAVRTSRGTELGQALVATGFSYRSANRARQAEVVGVILPRVRDIRRFGSGALDLCLVAGGYVDAYFEEGLQPWDLAAAGLIATEAGARVEGLHGAPASAALLLAAPPQLFDALHDMLAATAEAPAG